MNHQQHPDGLKRQARQVYEAHGAKRAAEVTHVPLRTVRYWARRDGWRQPATATRQPRELHVAPVAPLPPPTAATAKRPVPVGNPASLQHDLLVEVAACLAQLGKDRAAGKSGAVRNW